MNLDMCKKMAAYLVGNPDTQEFQHILKGMTEDPMANAVGALTVLTQETPSREAMFGFMVGLSFARGTECQEFVALMNEFFEKAAKAKGENVVPFNAALRKDTVH